MDAYSPNPLEGLNEAMRLRKSRVSLIVLIGALTGAVTGFFLQYYAAALDFPINVGGRPLNSWVSFIPITFELTVLFACLSALFFGILGLNGLPRPYHPVFNVPQFGRASRDRFFVCIESKDPQFDAEEHQALSGGPGSIGGLRCRGVDCRICCSARPGRACSAGCRADMQDTPKAKTFRPSRFFDDRMTARQLVAGTVPARDWPTTNCSTTARVDGRLATVFPFPITREVLARGQERYNIFCSPCHGRLGDGDGMIVRRGFRHPPSYHIERLRKAPVGHFYDVITHGFGSMYDYADRVAPRDRWAIIAYIRALQFSQNATLADVPAAGAGAAERGGRHMNPERASGRLFSSAPRACSRAWRARSWTPRSSCAPTSGLTGSGSAPRSDAARS